MNASSTNGNSSMIAKLQRAVRTEGVGFLFRGWTPAWVRLSPNVSDHPSSLTPHADPGPTDNHYLCHAREAPAFCRLQPGKEGSSVKAKCPTSAIDVHLSMQHLLPRLPELDHLQSPVNSIETALILLLHIIETSSCCPRCEEWVVMVVHGGGGSGHRRLDPAAMVFRAWMRRASKGDALYVGSDRMTDCRACSCALAAGTSMSVCCKRLQTQPLTALVSSD